MVIAKVREGLDNYNSINALRKRFKNATRHKYVVCGVDNSRYKHLLNLTFDIQFKKQVCDIKEQNRISICMDGTVVIRYMPAQAVGSLIAVTAETYDNLNSIVIDMISHTLELSLKRI